MPESEAWNVDSGAITNQKEGVNRVRRLPLKEGCRKARPGMRTAMSSTTKSWGQQSSTTSFGGRVPKSEAWNVDNGVINNQKAVVDRARLTDNNTCKKRNSNCGSSPSHVVYE